MYNFHDLHNIDFEVNDDLIVSYYKSYEGSHNKQHAIKTLTIGDIGLSYTIAFVSSIKFILPSILQPCVQ